MGHYGRDNERELEDLYLSEGPRQVGVTLPAARRQQHILIIRLDLVPDIGKEKAREGLLSLCTLFKNLLKGKYKIERTLDDGNTILSNLNKFFFTPTIGFGATFFNKLEIPEWVRPRTLHPMPDSSQLGDPRPYSLLQTDLLIQLASSNDFVNRWVFEYSHDIVRPRNRQEPRGMTYSNELPRREQDPTDIVRATSGWANITDLHVGFQRSDGRNLMGFKDGISNPSKGDLENIVWTDHRDESEKLINGTYMVFQKISHDLEIWRSLPEERQEEIIGRSKGTGLLLGTLSKPEDDQLALELVSTEDYVRERARARLRELLSDQRNPETRFFDPSENRFKSIQDNCPSWSHVRKANPRQENNSPHKTVYRRGYLFSDVTSGPRFHSGLLFICFQRNINDGFEYIKKKWLNNKNFPVPEARPGFTEVELEQRHSRGRFTVEELKALSLEQRRFLGLEGENLTKALRESMNRDTQNSGREGLTAPSELGIYPLPSLPATTAMGGGYYFIPPIPSNDASKIGQQFFE
jgi:Dyp-type peroxidase family